MIDIQQTSLSTLEEQPLAVVQCIEQIACRVSNHRTHAIGGDRIVTDDLIGIHLRTVRIERVEDLLFERDNLPDLCSKRFTTDQIADADCVRPSDFVPVACPDAAHRGADCG